MKKIFTLLSLCLLTLTSYAQKWLSAPISGKQYYIAVGHQKVGYITANENGANLTAKAASKADKSKQTWTCYAESRPKMDFYTLCWWRNMNDVHHSGATFGSRN